MSSGINFSLKVFCSAQPWQGKTLWVKESASLTHERKADKMGGKEVAESPEVFLKR